MQLNLYIKIAAKRETVLTGFKVALVVGCILNLINQGDLLLAGQFSDVNWAKFMLTFCVPFCVSVYSATISRLRFDPGVRAPASADLKCKSCGKGEQHVEEGAIVDECPGCGKHTHWTIKSKP